MLRLRNIAALSLAIIFVAGTVLAPVSHYSYMVWADWSSDDQAMHHMPAGSSQNGESDSDILTSVVGSESCSYWDLVATLLLLEPVTAEATIISPSLSAYLALEDDNLPPTSADGGLPIRGPPIA